MIIEGFMAIIAVDNPTIVRHKVESLHLVQPRKASPDPFEQATVKEIGARLIQEDLDQMSFEVLSELIADMAFLARSETLAAWLLSSPLAAKAGSASQLLHRGAWSCFRCKMGFR